MRRKAKSRLAKLKRRKRRKEREDRKFLEENRTYRRCCYEYVDGEQDVPNSSQHFDVCPRKARYRCDTCFQGICKLHVVRASTIDYGDGIEDKFRYCFRCVGHGLTIVEEDHDNTSP